MKKIIFGFAFVFAFAYTGISTVAAETYEVEEGDSLWQIADQHDTSVEELKDINDLDTSVIQPEQELTIQELYEVEKGDTLSGIGKEYDVEVDELKEWNELDTNVLTVGQELKVKASKSDDDDESTDEESHSSDEQEANEPSSEEAEENEEGTDESGNNEADEDASADSENEETPEGETFEVTSTAYSAECEGCSGVTSTGVDLNEDPDAKVIAVDPDVIPLGSEVYVEGYGYATAEDTGGAINGDKIDLHVSSQEEASDWGVQTVDVTIVD